MDSNSVVVVDTQVVVFSCGELECKCGCGTPISVTVESHASSYSIVPIYIDVATEDAGAVDVVDVDIHGIVHVVIEEAVALVRDDET